VLYTPEGSAQAPKLIHQLVNGDDRGVVETACPVARCSWRRRLAAGFFLSVTCTKTSRISRRMPTQWRPEHLAATTASSNSARPARNGREALYRARIDSRRQSAIPTLLLSGEFDPVTPPSGAEEVARGLSKGRHIVVRNNGHPIGNAEACIGKMFGQFLDAASVDARRCKLRRRQSAGPVRHSRKTQ
jgi:pimeloyl-ACP methyl ester carboxylesterase